MGYAFFNFTKHRNYSSKWRYQDILIFRSMNSYFPISSLTFVNIFCGCAQYFFLFCVFQLLRLLMFSLQTSFSLLSFLFRVFTHCLTVLFLFFLTECSLSLCIQGINLWLEVHMQTFYSRLDLSFNFVSFVLKI